eukprot:scaffold109221_cov32-Tisochrysis_lutea.AAC.2
MLPANTSKSASRVRRKGASSSRSCRRPVVHSAAALIPWPGAVSGPAPKGDVVGALVTTPNAGPASRRVAQAGARPSCQHCGGRRRERTPAGRVHARQSGWAPRAFVAGKTQRRCAAAHLLRSPPRALLGGAHQPWCPRRRGRAHRAFPHRQAARPPAQPLLGTAARARGGRGVEVALSGSTRPPGGQTRGGGVRRGVNEGRGSDRIVVLSGEERARARAGRGEESRGCEGRTEERREERSFQSEREREGLWGRQEVCERGTQARERRRRGREWKKRRAREKVARERKVHSCFSKRTSSVYSSFSLLARLARPGSSPYHEEGILLFYSKILLFVFPFRPHTLTFTFIRD